VNDETSSWKAQFREGLSWLKDSANLVSVPREIHKRRYAICQSCEEFRPATKQCRVCDCFMPLKTRMNIAPCPLGKWGIEAEEEVSR